MIVEMRTYTFHPGSIPRFLEAYRGSICDLQCSVLGNLLGYFCVDTGPLNQTVHLWGFESLDERSSRRASLASNPDWQTFLGSILPLIQRQESRILMPAPFSPIGGDSPGRQ